MIGWRKHSWNPERVSSVFTFVCVCLSVCVSVRNQAIEHTFWPRNLIFGLSDPWDMRIFLNFFFEILIFTLFIGIFRFFSLYNTFLVSNYQSQFFTFLAIFPYNFGDSWDIHGMRHIILGYFFPTIMMEIRTFHFRIPLVQEGQFFPFLTSIFRGPMKWDLCLLI